MERASQKHTQELSNITCELRKQKESEEQQRKMQAEKNRKSADSYAKQAREKWISPRKKLLSVVMFALSVLGVLGTVFFLYYTFKHAIYNCINYCNYISNNFYD